MEVEEFLKEAAVMKEIKHPNLVQLLGEFLSVLVYTFRRLIVLSWSSTRPSSFHVACEMISLGIDPVMFPILKPTNR